MSTEATLAVALEGRLLAALKRGGEIGEAAAEVVDARVDDLERDVRVDRIGAPAAGRCKLLGAFDD